MNMERIRCGGLIERQDMIGVEVLGFAWHGGKSCGVLGRFADAGVALGFLNMGVSADGLKTLTVGIPKEFWDQTEPLLDRIREEQDPESLNVVENVSILTLYGPHFYEKIGLSSEFVSALCLAHIDFVAVGSSVNSISVMLARRDVGRAREALARRFEWPE